MTRDIVQEMLDEIDRLKTIKPHRYRHLYVRDACKNLGIEIVHRETEGAIPFNTGMTDYLYNYIREVRQ